MPNQKQTWALFSATAGGEAAPAPTPFVNTYSLEFDGVDDVIPIDFNLSYLTYPNITFSCWVKMDAADLSTWSAYYPVGAYTAAYINSSPIRILTSGTTAAYVAIQGAGGTTYSTTNVSDGNWHHILQTCEYDSGGTICNVWIDGVKEITDKLFLSWGKITGDLIIGAQTATTVFFTGNVDEVSVWNSILSDADIATLASGPNNLKTALSSTPLVWYRNGDGSNTEFFAGEWNIGDEMKSDNWSNYSMEFDGIDDRVAFTEIIYSGAFSFSFWIKPASLTLAFLIGDINSNWHFVWLLTASTIMLKINGTSYTFTESGGNDIVVGDWQNIIITRDGSDNVNAFRNGASFGGTSTLSGNFETNSIGEVYSAGNWNYAGNIDDVAAFNNDQSANAVAIYNSGEPTDLSGESGLVGYWRMGESGYWNATNWQLPDYSKQALFSQKSFVFDGVDQYVDCGSGFQYSAVSVSVWINFSSVSAWKRIFQLGRNSGNIGYGIAVPAANSLIGFWSDGSETTMKTLSTFSTDTWYHIVMTYDSGTLKMYVDGADDSGSAGTGGDTGWTSTNDNLEIGRKAGGGQLFTGNIDDISIWNKELSAVEVSAIYNSGKPKDESATTGLVGYWTFDDATFSTNWTVPDNSSNSNNGTSANMDEVDLQFITPTNPNRGLSSGMDEVDKINNAPDNTAQGRSVAMDLTSRVEETP